MSDPATERGQRPGSRKRLVFWAVTLLLPVAGTAVLGELALRFARRRRAPTSRAELGQRLAESARTEVRVVTTGNLKGLVQPSRFANVVYELKPSHEWIFQGAHTVTNRHGFRGRDYSERKPEGTLRILGLGDSVMFGWGVDQDLIYTSLLERELGTPGRPVEVLNLGVPGYNTMQEAALLESRGLAFSPDVVLLNYCLNDWAAPFFLPDERGGIVEKSVLFQALSERLGRNAEREYTAMQGMDKVEKALGDISRMGAEHGFTVLFFHYSKPLEAAEEQRLRALAAAAGLRYVDVNGQVLRYCRDHGVAGMEALAVKPGDMHPGPRGHRLIADALEPALSDLLDGRTARPASAPLR